VNGLFRGYDLLFMPYTPFIICLYKYSLMGKKRREKRSSFPKVPAPDPATPPDPRAFESLLRDIQAELESREFSSGEEVDACLQTLVGSRGPGKSRQKTPLEQAQDLCWRAYEGNEEDRDLLPHLALDICPDCADAYVILAGDCETDDPEQAMELYQEGVTAGERALGRIFFEENEGDFWMILETRPYMRARFGLARMCSLLGRKKEAASHMEALLRLNQNDNQGVRDPCAALLMEIGEDARAKAVLDAYEDDALAAHAFNRALWIFRHDGLSRAADNALSEAMKKNRYVVPYLSGTKKIPSRTPDFFEPGDRTEAVEYVADAGEAWNATPGAIEWLKEIASGKKKK
jgi:tetratricopeptide (TPR) repeat protein